MARACYTTRITIHIHEPPYSTKSLNNNNASAVTNKKYTAGLPGNATVKSSKKRSICRLKGNPEAEHRRQAMLVEERSAYSLLGAVIATPKFSNNRTLLRCDNY
jgi:hypothetical protein